MPLVLVGAVLVSAAIHLTAVVIPGLRPVFRTFTMTPGEWALLAALSFSIIPAIEILKAVGRMFGATDVVEVAPVSISGSPRDREGKRAKA